MSILRKWIRCILTKGASHALVPFWWVSRQDPRLVIYIYYKLHVRQFAHKSAGSGMELEATLLEALSIHQPIVLGNFSTQTCQKKRGEINYCQDCFHTISQSDWVYIWRMLHNLCDSSCAHCKHFRAVDDVCWSTSSSRKWCIVANSSQAVNPIFTSVLPFQMTCILLVRISNL